MYEYQSIFTRLIKYLLEGIAVAIAATLMSRNRAVTSWREIAIIAASASLTFFLLDTLAPSMSFGARTGTGFGIGVKGVNMVGGDQGYAYDQDGGHHCGNPSGSEPRSEGIYEGQMGGAMMQTPSGATSVDATSDAKELPSSLSYGNTMVTPVTTSNGQVVSPSGNAAVISNNACAINPGACATAINGSPLYTQPINACGCTLNCKPMCQEMECPVSCPLGQTVFPNCNIASNNSPYKIVPGMYSHQIVLPGYNECVKPYNYYETPLGQN